MINKITFKSIDPFVNEKKVIEFGKVNIIIGPKGGGKSTLYDLLANVHSHKRFSSVSDALKEYGLEVENVEVDGEKIPFKSFTEIKIPNSKKAEEIKAQIYNENSNIIYQDDPIKKNLSSSKEFEKMKFNFAKEIVAESDEIAQFISKIKNLYDDIYKVVLKDETKINWSNSLMVKNNNNNKYKSILNLDFSTNFNSTIHDFKEDKKYILNLDSKLKEDLDFYKNQINSLNEINYGLSLNFKQETIKNIKEIINKIFQLRDNNKKEIKFINKKIRTLTAFNISFEKVIIKIKNTNNGLDKLNVFIEQATNHFKEMSRSLKKANNSFGKIINSEIEFEINRTQPTTNMLNLALKTKLTLLEEQKYELLKIVLYNAKKVQEDVGNWIIQARSNNNQKEFLPERIEAHIARILKESIQVLADGQDYDKMSLGQRSIYGIKYKFNQSKGKAIFLDQPEDNLDNHTIATSILDLINSKQEQVFIVTHNANIGILSKPDKVIVAKLERERNKQTLDQYQFGVMKETPTIKSDSAFYLEGGTEFITERLKIIKGDK